jgi:hypothetical protein
LRHATLYLVTTRFLFTVALCALVLVGYACGGTDSTEDATATATPRPLATLVGTTVVEPTATSIPGAHAEALLTVEELGEGWTAFPTQGAIAATQVYCDERIEPLPIDTFATFINTSAKRTLYQAITTLEDDAAAQAYIDRLYNAMSHCQDWISTDGTTETTWHTTGIGTELEFGDGGVEQVATTQLSDRQSPSATYSIIARRGATIMIVSMFKDGEPDDTAYPIAKYAFEKLSSTEG